MTDVQKMEKQWRTTMDAGQEDHNEGNLTFAWGMQFLCSQTSEWIQYPQAHTKNSWGSEQLPSFLGRVAKATEVPGHLQAGAGDAGYFQASHTERVRSAAPPAFDTFSSYCCDVSHYYVKFSSI